MSNDITMKFFCKSCSKERCPYKKENEFTFVQGCYPCECIYTAAYRKIQGNEKERAVAQNSCTSIYKCPYSAGNDFKPSKFGCPKFSGDGKAEFCPIGVRGIATNMPESYSACFMAEHYTFNPQADLTAYSVNYITRDTPLDAICGNGFIMCVRHFAESYSPEMIKSFAGITEVVFKTIAMRMAVYGYEEKDNKWRKCSVEEMQDWVALHRYSVLQRRYYAIELAKKQKEMAAAKTGKEVR